MTRTEAALLALRLLLERGSVSVDDLLYQTGRTPRTLRRVRLDLERAGFLIEVEYSPATWVLTRRPADTPVRRVRRW